MSAKYTLQPYTGPADLDAMLTLAQNYPDEHVHVIDLPYRLCSWAFDFPDNAAVWLDDAGQLAGWAVLQPPFWALDFALRPEAVPGLLPLMLAWADERARAAIHTPAGRPTWFAAVFARQAEQRAILEAAGFADQSDVEDGPWSQVLLARPAGPPAESRPLPAGFHLRPLSGAAEAAACVELHRAAFESKNMTLEWRQRTLQHPAYRPELDLVISAPAGGLAAFCTGWFHPSGPGGLPSGQIEPLGVLYAYRQMGLSKLLLGEQFRRMQALGAAQILVETDNYRDAARLAYEAAGFQRRETILMYRKDYS